MSRKRRAIQPRRVIFLGCEGESEQSYGAFLKGLSDEYALGVHIDIHIASPAGDSLAIAEKTIKKCKATGIPYIGKFLLLDQDKALALPDKAMQAKAKLTKAGITAIWQKPDHEGLLLCHFESEKMKRPSVGRSLPLLRAIWPEYKKGITASYLRKKFTLAEVNCAGAVITELNELLRLIRLPLA